MRHAVRTTVAICIAASTISISACSGGSTADEANTNNIVSGNGVSSSVSSSSSDSSSSSNTQIQGIATPSGVAVVTATNAE